MIRASIAMVSLLAGSGAPALAAKPIPQAVTPTGKWVVAFEDDQCVAAHDYAQGGDALTIAFRPFPTQQGMEIVLIERTRDGGTERTGKGQVSLNPGNITTDISFRSFAVANGRSATHVYADRALLTALASASELTIDTAHHVRTIPLTSAAPLIKTLHQCEVQLLTHWGVNPDLFFGASPPVPAEGNPARWFGPGNYPTEAIAKHEQGRVVVLLGIDAAGLVTDCRVVTSSKSRSLDDTTCRAARNIRYTPAHDANGKTVATWSVLPVNWTFPQP